MAKTTGILLACLIPCVLPLSAAAQCKTPRVIGAAATSSSSIKVTWHASAKALTYRVFRSTTAKFDASSSNEVKPGVNGVSYTDTKLSPITTYYYRIEAVCSSDQSSASKPSAQVSGTTLAASPATQTWSSLYTRALVGVEIAGGSSLATQPKAFLDFNLTAPFPFQRDPFRNNSHQLAANKCVGALDALSQSLKSSSGGESKNPSQGQKDKVEAACSAYHCLLPSSLQGQLDAIKTATTAQEYESEATAIRTDYTFRYSPIAKRAWFWLNPRITAAPSQVSSLLTTVATPNPSFNSLLGGNYNQIVQNFSTVGGIEFSLLGPRHWVSLGAEARMGLWLIAGAGFQTPLSATSNNAQIFSIPIPASQTLINQLQQRYKISNLCTASGNPPTPAGCTDAIAFVPVERSRFYYQGFAGLRLKTYYFKYASGKTQLHGLCDNREPGELCPIFPGIFDISVGQNSAYTGGFLHGWLLRTEAFYPLPFYPALHLYFTSWINVTQGNNNQTPLLLNAAGSDVSVTSPGVEIVTLNTLNRDYYRIGAGLDLVQLIRSLMASSNKASASKK